MLMVKTCFQGHAWSMRGPYWNWRNYFFSFFRQSMLVLGGLTGPHIKYARKHTRLCTHVGSCEKFRKKYVFYWPCTWAWQNTFNQGPLNKINSYWMALIQPTCTKIWGQMHGLWSIHTKKETHSPNSTGSPPFWIECAILTHFSPLQGAYFNELLVNN